MTLLRVVQDVCAVVGITQPTSVFSGLTSNRTMQEMLALANEMSQRIAYDTREWSALKAFHNYTVPDDPEAFAEVFPVPANFKRLLLTSEIWRYPNVSGGPMRMVSDANEWIYRRMVGRVEHPGEWIRIGQNIHIWPPLVAGEQGVFAYLDKNCVVPAAGGLADHYVADGDTFLIDERLLKLGMIWQWKSQKGSPYAEDMGTYTDALMMAMGADKPAPIIHGRKTIPTNVAAGTSYSGVAPMP